MPTNRHADAQLNTGVFELYDISNNTVTLGDCSRDM